LGVVQIRVTRETWNPLVGAALATFGVTHKPPVLNHAPALPLFAGGKSFGARMTSQAQAEAPLPDVRGLAFLGFPLHPAGKPSADRAQHLFDVRVPMLFLQGTRDALADLRLLVPLAEELGQGATLSLAEDGDHSFHVRARSGRTDEQALGEALAVLVGWMGTLL